VDSLDLGDITVPASRHNVRVMRRADLTGVRDWTQAELYAAVERADDENAVVIDYGRELLYLVDQADVTFVPPVGSGCRASPASGSRPRPYMTRSPIPCRGRMSTSGSSPPSSMS